MSEQDKPKDKREKELPRNYLIFKSILETFWAEGHLTETQKNLINRKKIMLGIPDDIAIELETKVKNKYRDKIT